jgi:hypothetical protein
MGNEFLGERRKSLEEMYFAKYNRKLLERLRTADKAPLLPVRRSIMNGDDNFDGHADAKPHVKSMSALSLVPLVAVAWAEGGVDDVERSIVLARAASLGLSEGDRAYQRLQRWLSEPPTPNLLATWKRDYVGALSRTLSHEAKRELKDDILRNARAQKRPDLSLVWAERYRPPSKL